MFLKTNYSLHSILLLGGPFLFSAAAFSLSLATQQSVSARDFGLYAFAQVMVGFGQAFSNAMFGSPLVVALVKGGQDFEEVEASFGSSNFIFVIVATLVLLVTAGGLGYSPLTTAALALWAVLSWTRWYFRCVALANNHRRAASISDVVSAVCTLALVAVLIGSGLLFLPTALLVMAASSAVGIIALSRFAIRYARSLRKASFRLFLRHFGQHGRWALLGVTSTEVVSNFHAYIITILVGPAAFAPIALATLLFRPVGVVLAALTQFERPQLASAVKSRNLGHLMSLIKHFRILALIGWFGNLLSILLLVIFVPQFFDEGGYEGSVVMLALCLMAGVTLLRSVRSPDSAVLQAAGSFRSLAMSSIIVSPITMMIVAAIVVFNSNLVVWSMVGILVGETVFAVLVRRQLGSLQKEIKHG